jgi:C2 domain
MNGLSDPFVVLGDEYQKRLAKTQVKYSTLNPRWDETFEITTQGALNIVATVWDWDSVGQYDVCGRQTMKLDPSFFSDYMPQDHWLDLDQGGRLLLRVSMEGEKDDIQFYFGKAFRTVKRTERDMTRQITDKLSAYIQHCLSASALKNLLNKGVATSLQSLWRRNTQPTPSSGVSDSEIEAALDALFLYFNENFAIMQQTLTSTAMITVMTRLWKEVLNTIEGLLVPPLSDKPSSQRQLEQAEVDVVFKWLQVS